jgi:hypothetical protein
MDSYVISGTAVQVALVVFILLVIAAVVMGTKHMDYMKKNCVNSQPQVAAVVSLAEKP